MLEAVKKVLRKAQRGTHVNRIWLTSSRNWAVKLFGIPDQVAEVLRIREEIFEEVQKVDASCYRVASDAPWGEVRVIKEKIPEMILQCSTP